MLNDPSAFYIVIYADGTVLNYLDPWLMCGLPKSELYVVSLFIVFLHFSQVVSDWSSRWYCRGQDLCLDEQYSKVSYSLMLPDKGPTENIKNIEGFAREKSS